MADHRRPPRVLAEFLAAQEYALVLHDSNLGPVFVQKCPAQDIATLRGDIPCRISHMLHVLDGGPAIRTLVIWHDRPLNPVVFEHFTNVDDPAQYRDWCALSEADDLIFLCYDERLTLALVKRVRNSQQAEMAAIGKEAFRRLRLIPTSQRDFDAVKAQIQAAYP